MVLFVVWSDAWGVRSRRGGDELEVSTGSKDGHQDTMTAKVEKMVKMAE